MTPEITRLFDEFKAENMSTFMQVHTGGSYVRVANWIEGSNVWSITPEGTALLSPEVEVESADMLASAPKPRARKAKVEEVVDHELDLEDL